jgi:hypothetical protein
MWNRRQLMAILREYEDFYNHQRRSRGFAGVLRDVA